MYEKNIFYLVAACLNLLINVYVAFLWKVYCFSKNGRDVDNICEGAATEVANASEDVSTYNALLKKFSTFLHPNHYLSTESIKK